MTVPLCTRCKAEPRRKGQRWGNACFARYMRETYRPKNTREMRKLRRMVANVRLAVSRGQAIERATASRETSPGAAILGGEA